MCQVRARRGAVLVVPTVSLPTTIERLRSGVLGREEVRKMLREGQRFMAREGDEEAKNKDELRREKGGDNTQELHVQEGDTITLVCVIQQQGKPPFVFWYHGEKMVNYDGSRNRLSVMTKVEGTRTHSRLTITDASATTLRESIKPSSSLFQSFSVGGSEWRDAAGLFAPRNGVRWEDTLRSWDSGNYSCIPPNVEPSFVIVFVTEGEWSQSIEM
ncbi:hypothetical protein O3P69_010898 [Scylla paramamosain]|uniref:Ig-like domain-containing protein n=1 Tax=Scylla paramamosain TaxID=85552 RepID=A0AAW0TJG8_SCYPA